jgi:hypothetical protein
MRKSFIPAALFIFCSFCAMTIYADGTSSSDLISSNTSHNFSIDLGKLVEESRANIKQVNQQIKEQAELKRNEMREEQAKEIYEQGLALTEQGRFAEARGYFERAVRMTQRTEMALTIKESEDRLRVQEEALKKAKKELDAERQKAFEQKIAKQEEAKRKQIEERKYRLQEQQKQLDEQRKQEAINEKQAKAAADEAIRQEQNKKQAEEQKRKLEEQRIKEEEKLKTLKQRAQELENKKKQEEEIRIKEAEAKQQRTLELEKLRSKEKVAAEERQEKLAKAKEELAQRIEALRKENEAKEKIIKQTEMDYKAALDLYKNKLYAEAKNKFEIVTNERPHYKATDAYLSKIDKRIAEQQLHTEQVEQERLKQEEQKVLAIQKKYAPPPSIEQQAAAMSKEEAAQHLREERNTLEQKRKLAEADYTTAIDFYKEKKLKESLDKFESVNQEFPGYKATTSYIQKIEKLLNRQESKENQEKRKAAELRRKKDEESKRIQEKHQQWVESHTPAKPAPTQSAVPGTVLESPKTEEHLEKTPVKNSVVESKKPEPVKKVVKEKESINAAQEAALLANLAERSSQLYRQISNMADDKNTVVAKNKLAKVEGILNNLKEEKERSLIQMRQEEERRRQQKFKEKEQLRSQEASKVYDEAVNLVSARDFDAAKKKFLEVENIQPNYKSTHNYLKHLDEDQRKMQEDALAEKTRNEQRILKEQAAKKQQEQEQSRQERITKLQDQTVQISQKAASINDDILKLTIAKDYIAAKAKFDELEQTMIDLKRVKDLIGAEKDEAELIKSQARERDLSTKQIENVLQEKRLASIQNKNDSVYKKRQQQDTIEAEAYKQKEKKRQQDIVYHQGIELYKAKKYPEARLIFSELASQGDKRAESYLKKLKHDKKETLVKSKINVEHERSEYLEERINQQRVKNIMDRNEQERQRKLSKDLEKQKESLEDKEQEERRRVEALKIQAKQRQMLEERQKQLEEKTKGQDKEYHFRKVQPSSVETKEEKSVNLSSKASTNNVLEEKKKELAEKKKKLEAENKLKIEEEKKRQAEEEKQKKVKFLEKEKEKEEDTLRIQNQKKMELEKSTKARQEKLQDERKAVRQQLENGVESMYDEAIKLYKSGDYTTAATRFSDVQDLMPNYKNSTQYLKKIQVRKPIASSTVVASPKTTAPSRDDQVSKTLDMFDSKP